MITLENQIPSQAGWPGSEINCCGVAKGDWPPNMRPALASRYSGVSQSHLAKLRMKINAGKGPPFAKVAGCVVYRRVDLDKWLADNLVGEAA